LIQDLLAYSRVDRQGKSFTPTDCNEVMRRVLMNLKVAIDESGAKVSSDPLPTVSGDAVQLMQLFQNLVGNAIKFRRDSQPRVHVGAQAEGDLWHFTVKDNGIGIAPENFERVFALFQRLHTRQKYPGTGIGLAICQKIVERHGGRIWIASELGQGTTFHFTVPQWKNEPGAPAEKTSDPLLKQGATAIV
jgi:light-regulated signal transduction histidine kinase (bacteriophytochrome)